MKKDSDIREAVKSHYADRVSKSCCSDSSVSLDQIGAVHYGSEELAGIPADAAQHSFGCGNPLAFAGVKEGQVVVDIGSGAGLDAMLAARAVGPAGIVFGIDMTPEMIERAEENARAAGYPNITFLLGEAENIPLEDGTADWVISNCVINLSPDKRRVFREIARILRPGGQVLISDMVAEKLPIELRDDSTAWSCCIAGAVSENEYLQFVREAGFTNVRILDRVEHNLHTENKELAEHLAVSADLANKAKESGTKVASIRLSALKP